jgi:hypothetical protein
MSVDTVASRSWSTSPSSRWLPMQTLAERPRVGAVALPGRQVATAAVLGVAEDHRRGIIGLAHDHRQTQVGVALRA